MPVTTTTAPVCNNKIQYVLAAPAMPAPLPMIMLPQMVPAPIPFQPALPHLAMLPCVNQSLPADNLPLFYDGSSFTEFPLNLKSVNDEGRLIAPPGYSFVTMPVPSASVDSGSVVNEELLTVPSETYAETVRSRSSSVASVHESHTAASLAATAAVAETAPKVQQRTKAESKPQNKKFRHRSKQTRILEVHQKLKEEYTAKGLYAGEDEVLRGFDTVRVHVKTYKALNRIECPLNDVEKHPSVQILKIATPFSMKNRFQKKGFIVYLKLATVDMVPIVQEIFSHYQEDFAKCDVALKKEDKLKLDQERANAKQSEASTLTSDFHSIRAYSHVDFSDWGMAA